MRRGFTILEMLIVVTVILALAGISYPILNRVRAKADASATRQLIQAVLAAINSYSIKQVTGTDNQIWPAWTLGQVAQDEATHVTWQIDGDPSLYQSTDPSPLPWRAKPSYTGFVNMTAFSLPWPLNAKGQLVDRWHQPLNIIYDPSTYGTDSYGIWSNGPDLQTDYPPSTIGHSLDDIVSWKGASAQ